MKRWVVLFGLLTGAMLLAVHWRTNFDVGKTLGPGYEAHSWPLYALFALACGVSGLLMRQSIAAAYGLALILCSLITVTIFPDISQLQVAYFVLVGLLVGITALVIPRRLHPVSLLDDLQHLWERRYMVTISARHNFQARYQHTMLGVAWVVVLPLANSMVMALAFSVILRVRSDVPFVVYLLSAIVPFTVFQNGVMQGTRSIVGMIGLIQQVYFPREILVLLTLVEVLIDFLFVFVALLVIILLYHLPLSLQLLWVPLLLMILVMLSFSVMLFVSTCTVFVRDIPQLVAVSLQLLFYLTPIIYTVDLIPPEFQFLLILNPLAAIVSSFRDVLLYQRAPQLLPLMYPLLLGLATLPASYAFFKSYEGRFADYA